MRHPVEFAVMIDLFSSDIAVRWRAPYARGSLRDISSFIRLVFIRVSYILC